MLTKQQIIQETALYYNSKNRAIESDGISCTYLANDGRKCAVGRVLSPEGLEFADNFGEGKNAYNLIDAWNDEGLSLDELFEESYNGHEGYFWNDLQTFHDSAHNWNEMGLTEIGQNLFNELLIRWA